VIEIEPIHKKSHRYAELLREGILISQFAGTYDLKQSKWRLDYILTRPVPREDIRRLLTSFVEGEYDAAECEFFKNSKNPDSIGCVKFFRGDL